MVRFSLVVAVTGPAVNGFFPVALRTGQAWVPAADTKRPTRLQSCFVRRLRDGRLLYATAAFCIRRMTASSRTSRRMNAPTPRGTVLAVPVATWPAACLAFSALALPACAQTASPWPGNEQADPIGVWSA